VGGKRLPSSIDLREREATQKLPPGKHRYFLFWSVRAKGEREGVHIRERFHTVEKREMEIKDRRRDGYEG